MRIFFDHQAFSLQTFGGISRYYAELITGINKVQDNQAYMPLVFSNNVHLQQSGFSVKPFLNKRNIRGKQKFIYETNRLLSIAKLRRTPYEVFHATYYDPYFIPFLKGRPFVVTFLDMIHEKFSTQFPELEENGSLFKQKQLLANCADKIIAISESTKRDVVELLQIDPNRIEVIYLGNSLKPTITETNKKNVSPKPYLLFVGRRERYKNFKGLLQSIHHLLKKYEIKLVCAGGGPFADDERLLIHSFGSEEWVKQVPIGDDAMLQSLYQQAIAFIFPTLYEGFGIPILEAFACECPCIVSNQSSLPEVAGDGALYIDPQSPESITNSIELLLHDSLLRQNLITKGREQLSHFSWENTVTKTIDLYKTII